MRRKIGQYDLGCRRVDLYVDTELRGGNFDCAPPSSGVATITVGLNQTRWQGVVAILVHEALELVYTDMGVRFCPTPDYANDSAAYAFMMNHTQFGEAVARASWMLADCLPDLSQAFKKAIKRSQ